MFFYAVSSVQHCNAMALNNIPDVMQYKGLILERTLIHIRPSDLMTSYCDLGCRHFLRVIDLT